MSNTSELTTVSQNKEIPASIRAIEICPTNYISAPMGSAYGNNNIIYFPGSNGKITGVPGNVNVSTSDRLCLGPSNATFKFSSGKYVIDTSKQIMCPMGTPLKSTSGNYYCVVDLNKY